MAPKVRRHIIPQFESGREPQGMEIAQVIQPDYRASQNFIWMLKEAALGRRLMVHSVNACPRPGVS